MFAYFKPNYSFFFIEISPMWTNKEFVAFKIATASKFGPNFSIFFTAQPTDVSFESQFQTNKEFVVAFKIAADGKLGPNFFLFSTVQPTDVFFWLAISLLAQFKICCLQNCRER
jgi:hypothetical protein